MFLRDAAQVAKSLKCAARIGFAPVARLSRWQVTAGSARGVPDRVRYLSGCS
jgi:hypothetical protein